MTFGPARRVDASVEWSRQPVFERQTPDGCLGSGIGGMDRRSPFFDSHERWVERIGLAVRSGSRIFGREDLPFMDLAGKYAEEIPFHSPLERFSEPRRRGIVAVGDDA